MANDLSLHDDFARSLLAKVEATPSLGDSPRAFYNVDGDCIEVLFGTESYRAQRLDDRLTLYRSRDDNAIVGLILKGVREFIHALLKESPGFQIEIVDGKVRLVYLITAALWKTKDNQDRVQLDVLRKIRQDIDAADLQLDLAPCNL